MATDNLRDRLASLAALLAADTEGPEESLRRLAGLVDAESFRRRLVLLIRLDRINEAYKLVAIRPPEKEWIEVGISVAVFADDLAVAERLCKLSAALGDSTGTLPLRCALAVAEAALSRHFSSRSGEVHISRYAIDPKSRSALELGGRMLAPLRDAILLRGSIVSSLERDAMTQFVQAASLIGSRDELERTLALVARSIPVSLEIGRFVFDGKLPETPGLAESLLRSHPGEFFAELFGVLLRPDGEQDWTAAFHRLCLLKSLAKKDEEREILAVAISETARRSGNVALADVDDILDSLLADDKPEHVLIRADHERRFGRFERARSLLTKSSIKGHPYWHWLSAQCDFALGQLDTGIDSLVVAALSAIDDSWLLDAADRAYRHARNSDSVTCLQRLRDYYPWLTGPRKNLAILLAEVGRTDEAAHELEYLSSQSGGDVGLRTNLARVYVQLDRLEDALRVLGDPVVAEAGQADIPVIMAAAYTGLGRPKDAFRTLNAHKQQFWNSKDFLFAYLNASYASGEEQEAGEALHALNSLREAGKVDHREFRVTSLDEVVEFGRRNQERRQKSLEAIAKGQLPWTVYAEAFRRPFVWDWMMRTQELRWLSEDVETRAEQSVYATHGFALNVDGEARSLSEIDASGASEDICVDYSALITLHALGQLSLFFASFRTIFVPGEYRLSILQDSKRLQPHQLSHREGFETIARMIALERIRVHSSDDLTDIAVIDEYTDQISGHSTRRLVSLLDGMTESGHLDVAAEKRLRRITLHKEDTAGAPVRRGSRVIVQLETLMSLYREGALEKLTSAFKAYISETDRREIDQGMRTFTAQDSARDRLRDLWNIVEKQKNVQFVSPSGVPDDDAEHDDLALASYRLARVKKLSLLADDRALQAVVTNERMSSKAAAFGTDAFLRERLEAEKITLDVYSALVVQLMRWRYRFLVPPAEVLHFFAQKYVGETPGAELVEVAKYAHDCMRDPGLLGGLESTTPPTSMALKLFMRWSAVIGEFLSLLWIDDGISDDRSTALTDWVSCVMLPLVPLAIREDFHGRVAALVRESVLVNALLRGGVAPAHRRVPKGLRRMVQQLGITERRYLQLVAEVVARAAE